jgi:hypothetical protein
MEATPAEFDDGAPALARSPVLAFDTVEERDAYRARRSELEALLRDAVSAMGDIVGAPGTTTAKDIVYSLPLRATYERARAALSPPGDPKEDEP